MPEEEVKATMVHFPRFGFLDRQNERVRPCTATPTGFTSAGGKVSPQGRRELSGGLDAGLRSWEKRSASGRPGHEYPS